MKNIHIIPTDKPSRLFKFANELHLDTIPKDYYKKYNIYITSDEEIKESNWLFANQGVNKIVEIKEGNYPYGSINNRGKKTFDSKNWKTKIILTTDQDLIKDGVQAIDDEFLEWFVRNPSCESVEVEKRYSDFTVDPFVGYKIIIPQEEPKQELLPDFKITKNIFDFVTDLSDTNKEEPKQDPTLENAKLALREHILANKEKVAGDLQEMRKKSGNGRYETLEEASEMFISKYYSGEGYERDIEEAIKFGAKWMEEEMEKLRDFETWKEWKNNDLKDK